MTSPAALIEPSSPLLQLLDEQFSEGGLTALLGPEAGQLRWPLWDEALYEPLRDFFSRPGKEFRGRLVTFAWQLGGGKGPAPIELSHVLEVLHAGSLIIDDIEDESSYRRGGPALHTVYGTAKALNAANWLYFWPAVLLRRLALAPQVELELHRAVGETLFRCHHGQALDLSTRIEQLRQPEVVQLVHSVTALKTGALMQLASELGARAAGGSTRVMQALAAFGLKLGVALQMLDDFGGLVSEKRCHKGHEDLLFGRPTWPWAWAAQSCDARTYARLQQMSRQVQARDLHPEHLVKELLAHVGERARPVVREHLKDALDALGSVCSGPALQDIADEISFLEQSYG